MEWQEQSGMKTVGVFCLCMSWLVCFWFWRIGNCRNSSYRLYVIATANGILLSLSRSHTLAPSLHSLLALSLSPTSCRSHKDAGTLAFRRAHRISCRNYGYTIHWQICINPIYRAPFQQLRRPQGREWDKESGKKSAFSRALLVRRIYIVGCSEKPRLVCVQFYLTSTFPGILWMTFCRTFSSRLQLMVQPPWFIPRSCVTVVPRKFLIRLAEFTWKDFNPTGAFYGKSFFGTTLSLAGHSAQLSDALSVASFYLAQFERLTVTVKSYHTAISLR